MKKYRVLYQVEYENVFMGQCLYESDVSARDEKHCVDKLYKRYNKNIKVIKIFELQP